jgi:thiol:disulfide interchange protein DsbA
LARKDKDDGAQVGRLRTLILAALGSIVAIVVAVGLYFVFQPVGEIAPGTHYSVLDGVDRSRNDGVVVTEYFSYGCIHCRNFDPQIEAWRKTLPSDVRFERVPVAFSPDWRALAQAYYAAESLGILERNHQRLFSALHDARLNLTTVEALAQFFDGHGTDRESFRRAMNAPAVRRALADAEQRAQATMIRSVPTLVVDDRYRIDAGELSRQQVLDVADQLIAKERAARQSS